MFWIGCLIGGIVTSVIIVILALRQSTDEVNDDMEVMEQIHKPSNMDGHEWD